MIGIFIQNLTGFRSVEITQSEVFDHLVGGVRTPVQYGDNCSWSWVRSVDEVVYFEETGLRLKISDLLEQYPDTATAYTPEQVFGYTRHQRDEDGEKMFIGEGEDRMPVMELVDRDETAWAAYASCHSFDEHTVTDELGTRTITPPILQHKIGRPTHLMTERGYHLEG